MLLLILIRVTECLPVGKGLFIRFTVRVVRWRSLICECDSFPFSFEARMWHLIVLVPGQCLSFYFLYPILKGFDAIKQCLRGSSFLNKHKLFYCTARQCCLIRQN